MSDEEVIKQVADKVMGWPFIPDFEWGKPFTAPSLPCTVVDEHGHVRIIYTQAPHGPVTHWNPLKSDADACAILDRMVELGFDCNVFVGKIEWEPATSDPMVNTMKRHYGPVAEAGFYKPVKGGRHQVENNRPEARRRAIILAALKAVGVEI